MADRDYKRGGDPENPGRFSADGGSAEKKDLERGKHGATKAAADRIRGKQIIQLQRLREAKLHKIVHAEGELPKGKTEAEHRKVGEEVIAKHAKGIETEMEDLRSIAPAGAEVKGRVKDIDSIMGKLRLKGDHYPDAKALGDVTGMRVVADSVKDAQKMVDDVRKKYGDRVVEFDDKFNKPQGDYRSFHLTVLTKDGLKAELQIRTKNQNDHADWMHNVYKPMNEAQKELSKEPHVREYSKKMADYFWDKDNGRDPGPRPEAPEDIKLVYGTPGSPTGYKRKVGSFSLPAL